MKTMKSTKSISQRAAELPAPQPGVVINMPLELWPAYQQLHGIRAMNGSEIAACEQRSQLIHKFSGPVWVTRAEEETDGA